MKQFFFLIGLFCYLFSIPSYSATTNHEGDRNFEIIKNLDLLNAVFRELDLFYVDSIKPQELIRSTIDKMLEELDPYTNFIPESEFSDLKYMATGEYGGIGVTIVQRKDSSIVVVDTYENMPAQKAGIKAGDCIVEINGIKMQGKADGYASELLRGEPGETVTLLIKRPGESKLLKKAFTREIVQLNPVDYYNVYDGIAYVYLSAFTEKSGAELKKVLLDMKTKNTLKGLIIDVRGNPGGIIDEAVEICNLFVPKGKEIVYTHGKDKQWDRSYKTVREPLDAEIPIVVLVNEESASASEIVAGALQDLDRAVVVGSRTFGKGLVQTTRPIGYGGYLKVTTAKYYTPSGRCIQAIDYEHKDKNGHAEKIVDSLTHEFKTANGRIVKDGGGITPDVILKDPETLDISYRLVADLLIFDYATNYCLNHSQISPVEDFMLTDADFEDFKQFLNTQKFSYQLRSNTILKSLKEIVKLEGYGDISKDEIEALEKKLSPNTDNDLELHKKSIMQLLSIEIVKRYYYQKGEIKEMLKYDDGLKKAIEILSNPEQYKKILATTI
jgi:carboxyl-terminal processing protease